VLVLARHLNESIMIGDEIEIVIVSVQHDQVKLGIRAPRHIAVHRKEIFEEIQRENILAAQARGGESVKSAADLLKKKIGGAPGPGPGPLDKK
jgi:carbon storage regulator